MAISDKQERDNLRNRITQDIAEKLGEKFDDVMYIESNQLVFPEVGEKGPELFVRITISVPTGSKGETYDGQTLAQDYVFKCEENERKRKEKEAEKKKKENAEQAFSF